MADFPLLVQKVVSSLPSVLTPHTLYLVRVGTGFDLYMTDSTGRIAHKINPPSINNEIELLKKYVQSRGNGLITNGNGMLLNNTNFSNWVFDRTDTKSGFGCFTTHTPNGVAIADELIPVDYNATYEISFWGKCLVQGTNNLCYAHIDCYDIDGASVQQQNNSMINVTLAQDWNPQNPTFVVAEEERQAVANFYSTYGRSSGSFFINSYNYTGRTGLKYPSGTYSRTKLNGTTITTANTKYDATTGVITGAVPASTTNIRAGEKVSISMSGGTFIYYMNTLYNHAIPNEWTLYKTNIVANKILRFGTAFIRLGWLVNRGSIATGTTPNKVAISNVNMRQI